MCRVTLPPPPQLVRVREMISLLNPHFWAQLPECPHMTPLLPSLTAVGDDLGGQEIYGPPLLFPPHWSCYGLSAQGRVFCVLDRGPFIGLWSVGSLAETHHKSVIRPGEPSLTRASRMSTGLSGVLESLIKLGRNPPGNGLGHKAGPAL